MRGWRQAAPPAPDQAGASRDHRLEFREIIKRSQNHGVDVETSTPAALRALVKSELVKWKAVVQKAKLTAD